MMAPGFPATISIRPPSCNTRSRIPAIPTPSNVLLEENLVDSEGLRVSPCTVHTKDSRLGYSGGFRL